MATEFRYTVKGCWPFPTDMLRHDGSRPASPEDAAMIARLSGEHAPDRDAFQDAEINLVGPCRPNSARWESFTWAVPTDHHHAFCKEAARRARDEQRLFDGALEKLTDAERKVVLERLAVCP